MTADEQINATKALIGNAPNLTDALVQTYLEVAGVRIINRLCPFGNEPDSVPAKWQMAQCELAARMFLRRGADGEVAHSENGIDRSYKSVDDEDILSRIPPYVGFPGVS